MTTNKDESTRGVGRGDSAGFGTAGTDREDAEILALRRARSEAVADVGAAMWAALDVVREHLGEFANWPEALKVAFSRAIVDPDQRLTTAETKHAQALAAKYGWTD